MDTKQKGAWYRWIANQVFNTPRAREFYEEMRYRESEWAKSRWKGAKCYGGTISLRIRDLGVPDERWDRRLPQKVFCPVCGRQVQVVRHSKNGLSVELRSHYPLLAGA